MTNKVKGKNFRLYCGDCLEVQKDLKRESIDALISDIPYGINHSEWDVLHNNKNSALLGASPAQSNSKMFRARGKPLNGWSKEDKNISDEYEEWAYSFLAPQFHLLKPASPILIMPGRRYMHRFIVAAEKAGFVLKDIIIWNKAQAPFRAQSINKVLERRGLKPVKANWRLGNLAPITEPIVYMFKPYDIGKTVTDCFISSGLGCFNSDQLMNNYIELSSRIKNKVHETQKPVQLFNLLVKLVTSKNHVVFDPFMGSGTTGVSCMLTGRRFIGIEKDVAHFNNAVSRISSVY